MACSAGSTISAAKGSEPPDNLDAEQRQLGCVEAAGHSDCRLRTLAGAFTEASGYAAGVELLAHNALPDAVFALNDAMAIGCLCALAERGIAGLVLRTFDSAGR